MHAYHAQERKPAYEAVMDPETASLILKEFNTKNRPISKPIVRNYAEMIRQGQWIDGLADIVFGKCGNLLNGQQTLSAIVETNTPMVVTIKVGYDDSAIDVLDTQRGRTVKDVLAIKGKNASRVGVSITSSLTRLANNWRGRPTMPALIATANKHQTAIRRLADILNEKKRDGYYLRGGFLAAITQYWEKLPAEAEQFLRDVLDDAPSNDAARKLSMRLYKSVGEHPAKFGPMCYRLALEAIHINHFKLSAPRELKERKEWSF